MAEPCGMWGGSCSFSQAGVTGHLLNKQATQADSPSQLGTPELEKRRREGDSGCDLHHTGMRVNPDPPRTFTTRQRYGSM